MSQSGYTPIQLYRTTTAAATPSAGNLAAGELAINTTDEKLYFKNTAGVVKLLAASSGAEGTVTSVAASGGTTGLTFSGSPITTSGTLTLGGTLGVANGGTGATSLTSGYLVKGNGTSAASASVVYDDGTNVGIGTSSPGAKLEVNGSVRFVNSSAAGPDLLFGNVGGSTSINNVANARTYIGAYETIFTNYDNSAEWMRIDASGNLGVGTSSITPIYGKTLQMGDGTTNSSISLLGSGAGTTGDGYIASTATEFVLNARSSTPMVFGANDTERMRITSQGDVAIGTTTPRAMLDVGTNASGSTTSTFHLGYSGLNFYGFRIANTINPSLESAGTLSFQRGTTAAWSDVVTISDVGNVGIGTSSPSEKLHVVGKVFLADTDPTVGGKVYGYQDSSNPSYPYSAGLKAQTRYWDGSSYVYGDRLTLDASGNLGIGTGTPGYKLDVSQGGSVGAVIDVARVYANAGSTATPRLLFGSAANEVSAAIGAQTTTATSGDLTFYTETGGSLSERMRIDSSGNVGIGTSAPDALLTVNTVASFGDGSVSAPSIAHKGDLDTGFWFPAVNTLAASTNGAERVRVTSTGQVFINSTTDGSAAGGRLHITGASVQTAASLRIGSDGYPGWYFSNAAGTKVGDIVINNASTAYNTTSDERLKENIADAEDAADVIDAIRIRQFDWKSNGSHQRYGVVAQELLEVAPEAVSVPGDSEDMMGVDYSKLVPMLIKEVQSLRARVAQLEGK